MKPVSEMDLHESSVISTTQRPNPFCAHLHLWQQYLVRLIESSDDFRLQIKYQRQLQAVTDVLYGVAWNIGIIQTIADLYNGVDRDAPVATHAAAIPSPQAHYFLEPFQCPSTSRQVVDRAIANADFFLIQGPPGTGKTTTIAEIVLQTLRVQPNARILICSEAHAAVDNALDMLAGHLRPECIMRYPASRFPTKQSCQSDLKYHIQACRAEWAAIDPDLADALSTTLGFNDVGSLNESEAGKDNTAFHYSHKLLAENISVVGITCNQLGRFGLGADDPPYDLVIIDEVSKATLPEILLAVLNTRKVIMVGDPMQLPPTFCAEELEAHDELENELLQSSLIDQMFSLAPAHLRAFLDTQHRMADQIGTLVSRHFYQGKLLNGRQAAPRDCVQWLDYSTDLLFPSQPVDQGGRLENAIEAALIVAELEELEQEFDPSTRIAIVTPYKAQMWLLRNMVASTYFQQVEIDTIDAFQGRQARIVFFSVTRNCGPARFYADLRRLNVAISRAQDRLYFVGSSEYLRRVAFFSSIIQQLKEISSFIPSASGAAQDGSPNYGIRWIKRSVMR